MKSTEVKRESDWEGTNNEVKDLEYGVDDIPPLHIGLVYSFQQVISNITGALSVTYLIHAALCTKGMPGSAVFFAELLSTSIFMMGVASLIQCTFGVRLSIVQGSSHTFIPPILAMMATKEWKCPPVPLFDTGNITETTSMTEIDLEPWKPRLREITGCLMAASVIQVILGCTGAIGFLMNYIGPITICPTITLIGLGLFEAATSATQHQWGIALLTVALVIIFSLILGNVKVPLPTWKRKGGCVIDHYRIFKLYPHIFAIAICWILCYILTVTDVFPNDPKKLGYLARTDAKLDALYKTKWFFFPYPGQWGAPTFSVGVFVGLIGATLSSIVESVGDYYATAKASQVRPPPKHAVNRGIGMEGFASFISGLVGAAHATTSYSGTVGFIQITGVASRVVWQMMSVLFIIFGVFGKFGAALTAMPDPIIGGINIISLGMVISIGLSTLQYVNINSSRNQVILAVSIMLGMMLPFWIIDNPGIIHTGSAEVDQLLEVILSTGTFVGGVLAFIMDNIIPGTRKERGLIDFLDKGEASSELLKDRTTKSTYDLPLITKCLKKIHCCTYVPFLPSYRERPCNCSCRPSNQRNDNTIRQSSYDKDVVDHADINVVSHL